MGGGRQRLALQGRAAVLDRLASAIDAATTDGTGRLVVLEGEPGIGKSRLIEEAGELARAAGVAVSTGAADPLALARPFGAFIDALDLAADPDLADLLFGGPADGGPDRRDVQYLVQEGIVGLLERTVATTPLLLALDDLQWADRATLATVVAIARRLVDLPLVVLIAARPAPRAPEMGLALGRLTELGGDVVTLGPLAAEDVGALTVGLLGAPPGPVLLDQLDDCGGNPFFVIETIRALEADGTVDVVDGTAEVHGRTLPAPLRTSLLRRVEVISPSAQEVLRTAAVLGPSFAVDDLAALLQRSVPATATATHEAVRAGLLEDAGPHLAFRHELIREALYADLPRAVRSALHRDAATALADRAPTHVIAQHLALGAEAGDLDAVAWLRRAAAEAGPRDPATAVDLLERALGLLDGGADADLRLEHVNALAGAGRLDEAERAAKSDLEVVDNPLLEGELRRALARVRLLQGNSLGAIHQLQRAGQTPGLDDHARAWIVADTATARFAVYDLDRTFEEATEAVRWGERLGDRALEVAGCSISCRVATMRADFDLAFALGERAVAAAADDAEALRRVPHLYLGVALYDGDRSSEAIRTMREGIRHSEALGAAWALPRQHNTLVAACFYAGAWDDALAEAETGATLAGEVGSRAWLPQAQSIAGTIAFHRDDLDTAREVAARARVELDSPGSDAGGMGWLVPLEALLAEADGELEAAIECLVPVHRLAVDLGVVTREQRVATQLVRLAIAVGDRDRAEAVTARVVDHGGPQSPSSFQGAARYCEGLLGDDGDLLGAAADLYRDASPIDFVISARAAADALDRAGRREDARPLLEESLQWCAKLGAARHGHAIATVLDGWSGSTGGERYQDRPLTGWDSLTPAELRVVERVGAGRSNADIAEELYVSRRTVESHLAHAYQKLQIKGRVALAIEAAAH